MTIKLKQNNLTNFYNAEPLGALGLCNQALLLGLCPLRFINCFISKYNWASLGHEEGRVAEDEKCVVVVVVMVAMVELVVMVIVVG